MNKDPIIAEVRKTRTKILEGFGWSVAKHHEEIKRNQKKYEDRLITLNPKRKVQMRQLSDSIHRP